MKKFLHPTLILTFLIGLLTSTSLLAATTSVSSTLNGKAGIKSNQLTVFDINIKQGEVPAGTSGKIVLQFTGNNVAAQASKVMLEYTLNGADWITIPISETGEAIIREVTIKDMSIAARTKFGAIGTYNYMLKLVNGNNEVLSTANESVVVGFIEPTINTTLDAYPFLIKSQSYLFHPFVTSGDRSDEMVKMKIVLSDPAKAKDIQFFRSRNADASEFTALTFNADGIITIGPETGYPLVDAKDTDENLFKVIFSAPGVYDYAFKIIRVDGTELAEVSETVVVSETAIGSTLGGTEHLKATLPVEFTVSASSATMAPETLVFGRLTLNDPTQRESIILEKKDQNGSYQRLSFGTDGTVALNTTTGIPLSEFKNIMLRGTFDTPGNLNYTLNLVKVDGNVIVATKSENITVDAFRKATLTNNFVDIENIRKGEETNFTLTTTKGDHTGKNAKFKFILADPAKVGDVIFENKDAADPVRLAFGTDGIAYYMPAEGPLATDGKTYNFIARFVSAGTYNYTVQLVDAANTNEVLASTIISVEAKTTAGITKGFIEGSYAVYPNITTGILKVDLADAKNATIVVVDMMGRSTLVQNNLRGVVQLDLSNTPKGTYFIKIQDGKRINTQRVVIQ